MSTPTLHPTARMRPVLLECLNRQRGDYWGTVMGVTVFAVYERMGSGEVDYRAAICGSLLAGVLPALPHERPPAWDAAMPVEPRRYALVRLVCGVVQAAFILGVVTGLYAALFAHPDHPGWYPLALFAWGLTGHLLLAATFLSASHPAVVLACLGVVGVQLLPGSSVDPAELGRMGVWQVLARTALLPGLAGAVAYAATRFPAPSGWAPRYARAPRQAPAPALPERLAPAPVRPTRLPVRSARRPARRAGPARPSAARTVFRRHLALLRRFTIVPALTLLVFAWLVLMQLVVGTNEAGAGPTARYFAESMGLPWWCAWIALSWTVLVRLGEHGAQRRWNDTLPVGTEKRRILHAAAGAAWLLVFLPFVVAVPLAAAAAAGTLASPGGIPAWLWLGLPIRTLTLYLAATLVLHVAHPAFAASSSLLPYVAIKGPSRFQAPLMLIAIGLGIIAIPWWLARLAVDLLEHLTLALAGAGPHGWSHAASALWLVPYAAAAAGAIVLEDWIHQRARLPTVREVRGFLRGWAGARPAPSLRGHPGR